MNKAKKLYVCLIPPTDPNFTPDPRSFYGIWEKQKGNVVSKCISYEFCQVLNKQECI